MWGRVLRAKILESKIGGIVMAWVCVGYSGEELVFVNKPHRRISKNVFHFDENDIFEHEWIDDKYCSCINLPKGSIKKLIGIELSWDDEPVELKEA